MEIKTTFDERNCRMASSSMLLLIYLSREDITFDFSIGSFKE